MLNPNKTQAVVVIPVYKDKIRDTEILSFRQVLKVLSRHPICLVTYPELDCSCYYDICKEMGVQISRENFPRYFFAGISGYNKLCLSFRFYYRFREFDYMLIYQLDAYVFKDELTHWCQKGYDYIGAPWFDGFRTYESAPKILGVGNGGFSLRKIRYFLRLLWWPFPLFRPLKKVEFDTAALTSPITFAKRILKLFGVRNSIQYYKKKGRANEDFVISFVLKDSFTPPIIPSVYEAAHFSIEASPRYLVGLNNGTLPFGCHAFQKFDFDFWKQYMNI